VIEEDEEDEGCEVGIGGGGLLRVFLAISTLILLPINKVPSNDKDRLAFSTVSNLTKANLTTGVILSLTILNGKKQQQNEIQKSKSKK